MSEERNALDFLEQLEDTKNIKKAIMFGVSVVILGVVGFCEVLYVAMILPAFPDGLIQGVAIVGACATGISAVLLLIGKLHWFSRGPQSLASWVFVGVETLILVLNVLLAVQLHNGHVDDWMRAWASFYPAAPIAAFIGWGVILFLDKTNKMRAMRRDQDERQEKAELAYQHLAFQTKMHVKHESLKILADRLEQKVRSQHHLEAIDQTVDRLSDEILSEISGLHITSIAPTSPPALPASQAPEHTVPSNGDTEVARLQRLKEAAAQRGYSIDQLEQMLGVEKETGPFEMPPMNATGQAQEGAGNGNGRN